MECLHSREFECFRSGDLSDSERLRIDEHLKQCAACRMQADLLAGDADSIFGNVRAAFEHRFIEDNQVDATRTGTGAATDGSVTVDGAPTIEGYRIVDEIHRGGQGVVYRAIQTRTKREVAIKILLEGALATRSARLRFEREIELVASLKHTNIIAVFHSGQTATGMAYCVMDYISGRRLDEHVREEALGIDSVIGLFRDICRAVSYAHQKGIIHRDLKPSNIIVDHDGTPKVLDFGLAKQLDGDGDMLSMTGQIMGTLPYMSPEQVKGNHAEVDTRTDIYALGIILYQLLTGQFPYAVEGQMADVLKNIAESAPTPPMEQWSAALGVIAKSSRRFRLSSCPIDDDVQTIILRCLAKEADRRYQSASALADDLERYLQGEAIEAKRDSRLYVVRKFIVRNKVASVVAAALMMLLSSTGMIVFDFDLRAREALAGKQRSDAAAIVHAREADAAVGAQLLPMIRELRMGWFLLAVQEGRLDRAAEIQQGFTKTSAERHAMDVVLADDDAALNLIEGEPQSAAVCFAQGLRLWQAQNFDAATVRLRQVIEKWPQHAWLVHEARSYLSEIESRRKVGGNDA